MHPNRRSDDPDDGKRHRLLDAVESTQAKVFARFLLPLLLTVVGFFAVRALNDIAATQQSQGVAQQVQGQAIAQIQSDVRNVNTRLDERVIRNVELNEKRIDKLEDRVELIERTVRVP